VACVCWSGESRFARGRTSASLTSALGAQPATADRRDRWRPAGPGISGAVRTQCGPGRLRSRAGSGPLRCADVWGAPVLRDRRQDRPAVPGWPFPALGGLGGVGRWSAVAASSRGVLRGDVAIPQRRTSSETDNLQETHEFYVASASALDMPRVRVSLRSCEVWRVGRRAASGSVRHSSHLSGGDALLLLQSKHERSNHGAARPQ
jgi:hypothetical protein